MKENLKTIFTWVIIIAVGGACVYGIRSCSQKQDQYKKELRAKEKIDKERALIGDKYIYQDKNGVFHLDSECIVLELGYLSSDENENATYSVNYQSKDAIDDWGRFVSEHQMCCQCFNKDLLTKLSNHSHVPPVDSVYVYDQDGKLYEKLYKTYDQWGNVVDDAKYELKEGEWVGSIREVFEYNERGQKIMEATYFWSNGRWEGTDWLGRKCEMEYDEKGNEILSLIYDWKDGDWILANKVEKTYDANNSMETKCYYERTDNSWSLKSKDLYRNFYFK